MEVGWMNVLKIQLNLIGDECAFLLYAPLYFSFFTFSPHRSSKENARN